MLRMMIDKVQQQTTNKKSKIEHQRKNKK